MLLYLMRCAGWIGCFTATLLVTCCPLTKTKADELDSWHFVPPGTILEDCCYANGQFVVVGHEGTIMHSDDGINWTVEALGENNAFLGIAYGNGHYVAVGIEGISKTNFVQWRSVIFVSADLAHWTKEEPNLVTPLRSVCFADGEFVAVGENNLVLRSSDGAHWEGERLWLNPDALNGAAYGNGRLVAVGGEVAHIITFQNNTVITNQVIKGAAKLRRVVFANGQFVVAGGGLSPSVLTSSDGINWVHQKVPILGSLSSICFGSGRYVAVGESGAVISSSDGINWIAHRPRAFQGLNGVCFGNDRFMAVGSGPTILLSDPVTEPPP